MKFSTTLALAAAPFALGGRVRHSAAQAFRRDGHLAAPAAPPAAAPAPPAHVPAPPEHVPAPPEHVPAPPAEHVAAPPAPPAHVPAPAPVVDAPPPPGGHAVGDATQVVIIWGHMGGEAVETTTYHEKVTVTHTVTVAPEAAEPTVVPGGDGVDHTVAPGETAVIDAPAASHTVIVGGPSGNIFQPESLEAIPVGDTVVFEFLSMNHTVTQSPFDTPCEAMEGGMDSGFLPNPDNSVSPPPQMAMQVMTDTPLWFYCRQGNHCGGGMVFSINPTPEKTQADFKALAIEQNGEGEDAPIVGGDPAAGAPEGDAPPPPPPAGGDAPPPPPAGGDAPPPPPADGGAIPGQGQIDENGNCLCVVSCSAGSFPVIEQGIGAAGGMGGGIPLSMAA